MEVRRQVPFVLRVIFQHQAPHHLSNTPPWSQNKLKIIPKFIPRLFRMEISAQSEALPWSQNKLKIILKFIPRLFRMEISAQSEAEILKSQSKIHQTSKRSAEKRSPKTFPWHQNEFKMIPKSASKDPYTAPGSYTKDSTTKQSYFQIIYSHHFIASSFHPPNISLSLSKTPSVASAASRVRHLQSNLPQAKAT